MATDRMYLVFKPMKIAIKIGNYLDLPWYVRNQNIKNDLDTFYKTISDSACDPTKSKHFAIYFESDAEMDNIDELSPSKLDSIRNADTEH